MLFGLSVLKLKMVEEEINNNFTALVFNKILILDNIFIVSTL